MQFIYIFYFFSKDTFVVPSPVWLGEVGEVGICKELSALSVFVVVLIFIFKKIEFYKKPHHHKKQYEISNSHLMSNY